MDCYNELLESFRRLKKRTLKIAVNEDLSLPLAEPVEDVPTFVLSTSPYASEKLDNTLKSVQGNLRALFNLMSKEERQVNTFGESYEAFEGHVFGTPFSLDAQLAASTGESGPLDASLILGVVENLDLLTKLCTREVISDDMKKRIAVILSIGDNGSVIIHNKAGGHEGMVVSDIPYFLKTIAKMLARRFGVKFKVFKESDNVDSGINSIVDKVGLKSLSPVVSFSEQYASTGDDSMRQSGEDLLNSSKPQIEQGLQDTRGYSEGFYAGSQAVSLDDFDTVCASQCILQDGVKSFISTFVKILRDNHRKSNPHFIVPSEHGVVEGWTTYDEAVFSMAKIGYTPEDIKLNDMIRARQVRDVFKDYPEILQKLKAVGKIRSVNDKVFVCDLESSFCLNLQDHKCGKLLFRDTKTALEQGMNNVMSKLQVDFGVIKRALDYVKKLESIEVAVRALPIRATYLDSEGRDIITSPLKDSARNLVDIILKKSSYTDIVGETEAAELLRSLEEYDLETRSGAERTKEVICRYMKFKQIIKDCKIPDSGAKDYLLVLSCLINGDDTPSYSNVGIISAGEGVSFQKMKAIQMVKDWYFSNKIDMISEGYKFTFFNYLYPNDKVVIEDKPVSLLEPEKYSKESQYEMKFSSSLMSKF